MKECLRCYQKQDRLWMGICPRCCDILEFGYPSFEGYPLDEYTKSKPTDYAVVRHIY